MTTASLLSAVPKEATLTTHKPAIGWNVGHGHTKVVLLRDAAPQQELVFPSLVARAQQQSQADLVRIPTVKVNGIPYWVGEDAQRVGIPPELTQSRIHDEAYIPVLVKAAMMRLAAFDIPISDLLRDAKCVSGLPGTWSRNKELCRTLADRLRAGANPVALGSVRIIAEPVGAVYSAMLDDRGTIVDPRYRTAKVAVVDFGVGTVDTAVVDALVTDPTSLSTYQLGTVGPLTELQQTLSARFEVDVPWHAVEQAVQTGHLQWGAIDEPLPDGWDVPFRATGQTVANRLEQAWKRGLHFNELVLAGGGVNIPPLLELVLAKFRHARVLPKAQLAIAYGYARYGRFLAEQGHG